MDERVIWEVDAWIVDASGSHYHLEDMPKRFDSNQFSHDPELTLRRAKGFFHKTVGNMYDNNANRKVQTCVLYNVYGNVLLTEVIEINQQGGE